MLRTCRIPLCPPIIRWLHFGSMPYPEQKGLLVGADSVVILFFFSDNIRSLKKPRW